MFEKKNEILYIKDINTYIMVAKHFHVLIFERGENNTTDYIIQLR